MKTIHIFTFITKLTTNDLLDFVALALLLMFTRKYIFSPVSTSRRASFMEASIMLWDNPHRLHLGRDCGIIGY